MKFCQLALTICTVCLLSLELLSPALARDLGQIQSDISRKQSELAALKTNLASAQADLNQKKSAENNAQDELSKLSAELAAIEAQLKFNQLQLTTLAEEKKLKTLEREENNRLQDLQVVNSYHSWKTGGQRNSFFGGADFVKSAVYNEALTTKSHGGILGIAQALEDIEAGYEKYVSASEKLQADMEELATKKQAAEARLAELKQQVNLASNDVGKLRTQSSAVQSQISQLHKEQQEILDAEKQIVNNNNSAGSNGGSKPLEPGNYYFNGTGRDAYQGHGVGMSQYGILGAALQGWDYKRIAAFYFPGATVGKVANLPGSINVSNAGTISTEDYVAGGGEIPDRSCEDLGIAFSAANFWGCWPREAIKAHTVVYRTYGARRSSFVYGDARGQVYKGGQAKRWAADVTASEVVTYNGALADVYYSSDNNQGFGNANNDTVWSNYSGDGTNIPYLRSVNDNSFAYKSNWTQWSWRTNSYSIGQIDAMLAWASVAPQVSTGARSHLAGVKSSIGSLTSISFERDPSNRVKKVVLTGDKGSRKIAGWLFKSVWNIWVGTVKPSGQTDYIYSLTFYLQKA